MNQQTNNLQQHRLTWFVTAALAVALASWSLGGLPGNGLALWAAPAAECSGSIPASFNFQGGVYEGALGDTGTPIANVLVQLYGSGSAGGGPGLWLRTTYTGLDGSYALSTQVNCPYFNILEVDPSGYVSVGALAGAGGTVQGKNWIQYASPGIGTFPGNNFFDQAQGSATATPSPTATPGTPTPGPSPTPSATPSPTPTGEPATGLICVRAFEDADGDGLWDAGEAVLAGARIDLKDQSFVTLDSYTTTGDEPYCFAPLPAGVSYTVMESDPVGYFSIINSWAGPLLSDQIVMIDFADVPQLFLPVMLRQWM